MSSIAALPPPSSPPTQSGLAVLRKLLTSDALPVAPVRPIPGQEQRRSRPEVEATDEALQGARGSAGAAARGRSGEADGTASDGGHAGRNAERPVTGSAATPTAGPSTAFMAQAIHQEMLGSGLTIEPWDTAIAAYRRAESGAPAGSLVSSVSV